MSAGPVASAYKHSLRKSLTRRVDRFVDPVIAIVAAALALTSMLTTDLDAVDPRLHEPNVLAALAAVVAAGALAWRRKRPLASYAVFLAGTVVVSGTFHYVGLLSVLILLSLFSLATHGSRKDGVVGLVAGIACYGGLWLARVPDLRIKDVLLGVALLFAVWAGAEALRSRRDQQHDRVRTAVTEERLRIARELHDVVAHSMSLIAVQAGVGAHVIKTDPAAAEQSLEVIADTSRKALEQTRSMLEMLRDGNEDGTRPPTRGLDDLATLVDDVQSAGLEVQLFEPSTDDRVEAAVSLAAYRIVQESLTNVIKHSCAVTATVTVTIAGMELHILVEDPGPRRVTSGVSGSAHGLLGLDERARLVGGTLDCGVEGEGFTVRATLPAGAGR